MSRKKNASSERFTFRGADYAAVNETAALLSVGRATVSRVLRRHRETKSLAPRPRGGGNVPPIHEEMAELLAAIVAEMPDATVAEPASVLAKRSCTSTSRFAVQRALGRLGFSRKKVVHRPRDTPEHRVRREEFCVLLKRTHSSSLVFIDASELGRQLRRSKPGSVVPYPRLISSDLGVGSRPPTRTIASRRFARRTARRTPRTPEQPNAF